jgi:hypothetical protein
MLSRVCNVLRHSDISPTISLAAATSFAVLSARPHESTLLSSAMRVIDRMAACVFTCGDVTVCMDCVRMHVCMCRVHAHRGLILSSSGTRVTDSMAACVSTCVHVTAWVFVCACIYIYIHTHTHIYMYIYIRITSLACHSVASHPCGDVTMCIKHIYVCVFTIYLVK